MKKKFRKAVSTHGGVRSIVSESVVDYSESDDVTEKCYRLGQELSDRMPKNSFGLKELGWLYIRGASVERARSFDVETVSLAKLNTNCTFEAAIEMVEQLRRKIFVEFGKEPPAIRQDLKDSNA